MQRPRPSPRWTVRMFVWKGKGKCHCLVPSLHLSNEEKHKKKQEYRDYFFNRYFYNKKFNMGYSTSVYDTHFYYGMIFSVLNDRR